MLAGGKAALLVSILFAIWFGLHAYCIQHLVGNLCKLVQRKRYGSVATLEPFRGHSDLKVWHCWNQLEESIEPYILYSAVLVNRNHSDEPIPRITTSCSQLIQVLSEWFVCLLSSTKSFSLHFCKPLSLVTFRSSRTNTCS